MMIAQYKNKSRFLLILPVFIVLLLQERQTIAQGHYSARIYSLGGSAVSGIIPDYLTDLVFNPAYAALADDLSINYGYRSSPGQVLPFPYLDRNLRLNYFSIYSLSTSEVTAYGIRISDWRLAFTAEWRFYQLDDEDSSFERRTYRWSNRFINEYFKSKYFGDDDYWRIDMTAAHSLGDEHIVGVRLGGSEYCDNYLNRRSELGEYYDYSEYSNEITIIEEYSDEDLNSNFARGLSAYLQIGLLLGKNRKEPSDIIFRISRNPISLHQDNYNLRISQYYDQYSEIERYAYYFDEWTDNRKGDLWAFDLWGRHTFPSGIRLFLGGGVETSSYELDWSTMTKEYEWETSTSYNIYSNALSGNGDFKDISFFTKVGKTFSIHSKLDVTIGALGTINRYWSNENPLASFSMIHETDLAYDSTYCTQKLRFESNTTKIRFLCPVALEYRPSVYFSCFAGFATDISWNSKTDKYTIPDFYSDILDSNTLFNLLTDTHGETTNQSYKMSRAKSTENRLSTNRLATIGFSIHYKDRFFIDLYTGSDLTPDSITQYLLDIRYKF